MRVSRLRAACMSMIGLVMMTALGGCGLSTTVNALDGEQSQTATTPPSASPSGQNGGWCDFGVRCEATTDEQLQQVYVNAIKAIDLYQQQYAAMPGLSFVYASTYDTLCPDDTSESSFRYCTLDTTAVFDTDMARKYYDSNPLSLLVLVAHEYAHHVQYMWMSYMGIDWRSVGALPTELQADCFVGAFMDWMRGQDQLSRERQDAEMAASFFYDHLGSDMTIGRRHGTADERMAAYWKGFNEGLQPGCNSMGPARMYN